MNLPTTQKLSRFSISLIQNLKIRTSAISMTMIIAALVAFEVFNFSSTSFALLNILGSQSGGSVSWSTILALAFCVMDFAGIARLLGVEEDSDKQSGWYLLGAWVLAAAMNAGLTWWGVSIAVYNQPVDYALIINPMTFVTVVPVLVAVMVWVIRILIIGSLVTSFNQSVKEKAAMKNTPHQARTFGFKPNSNPVPSGYQPIDRAQGFINNHRSPKGDGSQ
ncbi:MAG: hypothetical protein FJZ98_04240 [Chloroflexi bacterium]|nr:hypothetical protein [Chloroflexota bacterium]